MYLCIIQIYLIFLYNHIEYLTLDKNLTAHRLKPLFTFRSICSINSLHDIQNVVPKLL